MLLFAVTLRSPRAAERRLHILDEWTQQHIIRLDIPEHCDAELYRQGHKACIRFFAESVANAAHVLVIIMLDMYVTVF